MASESTVRPIVLLLALSGSVVACGEDTTTSPGQATLPPRTHVLNFISPKGAVAGSTDLTLTLSGSGFVSGALRESRAAWRSDDGTIYVLETTFVGSTRLTAVVPASLLRAPVAAQVYVATVDVMADFPLDLSNAVPFMVAPGPQVLDSISPEGAVSGSPDLTLTLIGSGFVTGSIKGSRAIWRSGDSTTYLATTFVSSSHLTAVVPAWLLRNAVAAQVYVATGDVMGDVPLAESNAVAFTVTPPPVQRRQSVLPKVFDVGTLPLGHSATFSRTLLAADPICLYWWDYRGFDVAEPCHGYRVTIPAAGHLRAILTWSPDGWMSLSTEDQVGLPTADGPPMRFSRGVQAGQTVIVTVGNHGSNAKIDYTLQLQLVP